MADPAFGKAGPSSAAARGPKAAQSKRSTDMVVNFDALPSTAAEARALAAVLPNARVLTQGQATESARKRVGGPRVLHIATHGFFLPDQPENVVENMRSLGLVVGVPARAF